jgi:hypothetical protein
MTARLLGVQLFAQEQSKWCWAAVTAAVTSYYTRSHLAQCEIVDRVRGTQSCCIDGSTPVCNQGHRTWEALDELGHLAQKEDSACDLATIKTEIDADRPVAVGLDWAEGTSHVVLIIGYRDDDRLDVRDPSRGAGRDWLGYHESLLDDYRRPRSAWSRTYYTKP